MMFLYQICIFCRTLWCMLEGEGNVRGGDEFVCAVHLLAIVLCCVSTMMLYYMITNSLATRWPVDRFFCQFK